MGKKTTNTNCKVCVLCKHWNGAVGSTTIQPKMGNVYEYDADEKKSCFKKRVPTPSFSSCSMFESRY